MRGLLMAVLLSASPAALAAGPDCPTTMPQAQINECYAREADESEKRLGNLLRELRRSLSDRNWSLLKDSHAFWEKTRTLDCKIEASFIEGPVRTAVAHGCVEKRTRERIHQLRYYLCPRYNLTGQCDAVAAYE